MASSTHAAPSDDDAAAFHSTLLPHQRLAATREERTIARWAAQQAEWEAQRTRLAALVGSDPSSLAVSHSEKWRERMEERERAERDAPPSENYNRAAMEWEMTLRDAGSRYVRVGNPQLGLWTAVRTTTTSSSGAEGESAALTVTVRRRLAATATVTAAEEAGDATDGSISSSTARQSDTGGGPHIISSAAATELMAMATGRPLGEWVAASNDAKGRPSEPLPTPRFPLSSSSRMGSTTTTTTSALAAAVAASTTAGVGGGSGGGLAELAMASRHAARRASCTSTQPTEEARSASALLFRGGRVLQTPSANEGDEARGLGLSEAVAARAVTLLNAAIATQRMVAGVPASTAAAQRASNSSVKSGPVDDTRGTPASSPATGPWLHLQVVSDAVTRYGVDVGAAVGGGAGNLPAAGHQGDLNSGLAEEGEGVAEQVIDEVGVVHAPVWPVVSFPPTMDTTETPPPACIVRVVNTGSVALRFALSASSQSTANAVESAGGAGQFTSSRDSGSGGLNIGTGRGDHRSVGVGMQQVSTLVVCGVCVSVGCEHVGMGVCGVSTWEWESVV